MFENIDWVNLKPFYLLAFIALGVAVVAGLLLQTIAIVRQSKSFLGMALKFTAMVALLVLVYFVKANAIPYLVVFAVTLVLALCGASLARRSLMR